MVRRTSSRTATTSRSRRTTLRGPGRAQPARLPARGGARAARRRHERRALPRAPKTTTRTTCCSASGSARTAATPTGCATTAGCTSRTPDGDRGSVPRPADVLENTLAIADSRRRSRSRSSTTCRRSRCPRASRTRTTLLDARSPATARAHATAIRCPPRCGSGSSTSWASSRSTRLRGLLPDRRRTSSTCGARPRHPGRPGPRLGGGLARRVRAAASPTSTRSSTTCSSSAS